MTDTANSPMTDEHLIGYCEIHCKTERALFKGMHVNRMLELAGNPPNFVRFVRHDDWYTMHEEMQELCDLARARMELHKEPITPLEESRLRAHGFPVDSPNQLSDAFRQGVKWALTKGNNEN